MRLASENWSRGWQRFPGIRGKHVGASCAIQVLDKNAPIANGPNLSNGGFLT